MQSANATGDGRLQHGQGDDNCPEGSLQLERKMAVSVRRGKAREECMGTG